MTRATTQVTLDSVSLKILPGDKRSSAQPASVKVTLEGQESVVKNIKSADLTVVVDSTQVGSDGMAPVQVSLPQSASTGVRIKKVEPERVLIRNR